MVHSRCVILGSGMKTLIQIALLALLVGCATPHYPVYVTSGGDNYIAERAINWGYYDTISIMSTEIGVYPWWVGGYPPRIFAYYSPYFYPYYFSVWYPPGYHPYYGFYGGYSSYWCPPYRIRRHHGHRSQEGIVGSPVMPPVASSGRQPANPELWRSIERAAAYREMMNRGGIGYKAGVSARSAPAYSRSQAITSGSRAQTGSARSMGVSRPSGSSVSTSRGTSVSNRSPALHDQ
jgi:hypothetical protein